MNDANELFTDAYSLIDFKISKLFSLNNLDINISSGINNIFDKKYSTSDSFEGLQGASSRKNAKTEKCVWTAYTWTDCM